MSSEFHMTKSPEFELQVIVYPAKSYSGLKYTRMHMRAKKIEIQRRLKRRNLTASKRTALAQAIVQNAVSLRDSSVSSCEPLKFSVPSPTPIPFYDSDSSPSGNLFKDPPEKMRDHTATHNDSQIWQDFVQSRVREAPHHPQTPKGRRLPELEDFSPPLSSGRNLSPPKSPSSYSQSPHPVTPETKQPHSNATDCSIVEKPVEEHVTFRRHNESISSQTNTFPFLDDGVKSDGATELWTQLCTPNVEEQKPLMHDHLQPSRAGERRCPYRFVKAGRIRERRKVPAFVKLGSVRLNLTNRSHKRDTAEPSEDRDDPPVLPSSSSHHLVSSSDGLPVNSEQDEVEAVAPSAPGDASPRELHLLVPRSLGGEAVRLVEEFSKRFGVKWSVPGASLAGVTHVLAVARAPESDVVGKLRFEHLQAVGYRKYLVSARWLEDSLGVGRLLEAGPYELRLGPEVPLPAARVARESGRLLLEGVAVVCARPFGRFSQRQLEF
ncbi:uncharacterized protein LOC106646361 [Copidosoma floridanum]|uniref:uncharacterized protein LOC106646361 n=1 Tax=Copidosoma floridanum TaxID=29053 RepID=UPI0006C96B7D|nr:uncharacterized protein LOC106646361 [Copidosoma floridanum]